MQSAGNPTPTAFCDDIVTQPRLGAFEANSGSWNACRKDENCSPCLNHAFCPGDRVCINLGAYDDTLSDYRCVPSCTDASDCTDGDAPAECNLGKDGFDTEAMGCFDPGVSSPVNFCVN